MSTKLYIGNLPETCRKVDLESLFQKYGTVVECDIVQNYAFVHYDSADDAQTAVDNLNGIDFNGNALKVELSHSKVRQKPGMGGKGDCYRCGKEGHWSKDCPRGPARGRGRGGGGRPRRFDPYERPPYRDPYSDPYYRDRYPPPPPMDRYRYADPYDRRPLPPPLRDPYYRSERDPYDRPPPEYYGRRSPPRDPYYDSYYARSRITVKKGGNRNYPPPPHPSEASRTSPTRSRVPGPY